MTPRWFMTALCAAVLAVAPLTAQAQDTYIDTNATVNTVLPDRLYIGYNTTNPITVGLVPGGSVGFNAYARNNATFNISGGEVKNNVLLTEQAVFTVLSGKVGGGIEANGTSSVTISGGLFDRGVTTSGNAVANISGGDLGGNFSGGSGYDITAGGNSLINVTGGTFSGRGVASNNAVLNILGGAFAGDLRALGSASDLTQIATLNLRGGTFGGNLVTNGSNALLNIYGFNLQLINPTPVLTGTQYDLLGTLEDGTSLAGKNLIVVSNGVVNLIPTGVASAPEPGTFALMALAFIPLTGVVRRRNQ